KTCAAMTVIAVISAGCANSGSKEAPGVTDTTVTIGSHQILTGPAAAGPKETPVASKAYFDYVNAHGGVNGRKIIYNYKDDAYSPANAVREVHRLVEKDKVFAIFNGSGTPAHQAVVDYLSAKKVPDVFPNSGCPCWNNPTKLPYTFGWQLDYHREGKILGSYISAAFPGKKIAYFYQNDSFGKGGVAGLDAVLPPAQIVAREAYKTGYNDLTPQMKAISQAKADVIVAFAVPTYIALLRLAQQKLGNRAQLVVGYAGSDPTTLSHLLPAPPRGTSPQAGNPLTQGIITDAFLPPVTDASNSWVALVKKIHDQYLPGQPLSRYTELGIAAAFSMVQALQQAGRNLTRQSLIAAVERGHLSPGFGLTPLLYSDDAHDGYTGAQIGVIRGNAVVLQGKPMVTDDKGGPVIPYTVPQAPAPADGIPTP
ncbi:ABC transporter substrate-binding protein, partial [Streptomyces sp. NPDC005534]